VFSLLPRGSAGRLSWARTATPAWMWPPPSPPFVTDSQATLSLLVKGAADSGRRDRDLEL